MKGVRGKKHVTRKILDDHIHKNPGVSFQLLSKILKINQGTLRYHLDYLVKIGRIKMKKCGLEKCYYPNGSKLVMKLNRTTQEFLSGEKKVVHDLIKNKPGISKSIIKKTLNIDRKTLNFCIRFLKEKHLIRQVSDGIDPCFECMNIEILKKLVTEQLVQELADGNISESSFSRIMVKLEKDI